MKVIECTQSAMASLKGKAHLAVCTGKARRVRGFPWERRWQKLEGAVYDPRRVRKRVSRHEGELPAVPLAHSRPGGGSGSDSGSGAGAGASSGLVAKCDTGVWFNLLFGRWPWAGLFPAKWAMPPWCRYGVRWMFAWDGHCCLDPVDRQW